LSISFEKSKKRADFLPFFILFNAYSSFSDKYLNFGLTEGASVKDLGYFFRLLTTDFRILTSFGTS
jgi:hypothetical protein